MSSGDATGDTTKTAKEIRAPRNRNPVCVCVLHSCGLPIDDALTIGRISRGYLYRGARRNTGNKCNKLITIMRVRERKQKKNVSTLAAPSPPVGHAEVVVGPAGTIRRRERVTCPALPLAGTSRIRTRFDPVLPLFFFNIVFFVLSSLSPASLSIIPSRPKFLSRNPFRRFQYEHAVYKTENFFLFVHSESAGDMYWFDTITFFFYTPENSTGKRSRFTVTRRFHSRGNFLFRFLSTFFPSVRNRGKTTFNSELFVQRRL